MNLEPLATLLGEPFDQCPADLFIPPDALRVFLDRFEGPLDLLLYLIRRQNLNILDIPMARVTAQYLEYIRAMEHARLYLAAEYLLMAAMLVEIKSRGLLPVPPSSLDEADEEDPRSALVRRLVAYEQIKLAAQTLDAVPRAERDFLWLTLPMDALPEVLPSVSVHALHAALSALFNKALRTQEHRIERSLWTVEQQMVRIAQRLQQYQRNMRFDDLFDECCEVAYIVVSFMAVLELAKQNDIILDQVDASLPIYLRWCGV